MTMRQSYEKCEKHDRTYCSDLACKAEETNAGNVTINTEGGLSIGIGSGLAIDPSDGSIGFTVGGITIDT
jgi:hypothetical protein